ncbi:glycine oxidase ThiO [Dictyobacter arantiisoli]|uniref:glycine oxidase n=1 Tax=Dictyobacter arantiisoli TaxID=2014874 RepID=A0A5A5T728_9CHLR|nr:glycine oxidase ThiO [Dictyobacter arantiisoli]GCF06996.1 glycine oxidase ThiO [Dictyobacter arantiisoli]
MTIKGAQSTDVVIVGGGIIGCATAYFLRKAQLSVTLLEQGEIGRQSSGAAAGLLAPLGALNGPGPFTDLLLCGFQQFVELVSELEDVSGLKLDFVRSGTLRVVRDLKYVARLKKRLEAWQTLGLHLSWLDGVDVQQLEPALLPTIAGAIYAPDEAQINPVRFVGAFASAACQLGARLYQHTTVSEIIHEQNKIVGVRTASGTTFTGQHVVLAAGVWSEHLCSPLNVTLPLRPIRGQMIALEQPAPALRHIVFGDAMYLLPRDTHVLVGATRKDAGFDVSVTQEETLQLQHAAIRLMPSLKSSVLVRAWAGLRPGTPDRYPILGPVPEWKNLVLATGYNSVGLMLSAITARGIAAYVMTGSLPEIMQPFTQQRFQKS